MNETKRVLNFKPSKTKVDAATIPDLIPGDILREWTADDPKPYFSVEMIEFPIEANNLIYEESFFKSFLSKLGNSPIPGSRSGHETDQLKRPPTDFVLTGGKIERNGNGSGKVFLKHYVPTTGETGDNGAFIKQLKSGMVNFSIVSYVRDEIRSDGKTYILESVRGERNDAVELNSGAMRQTVNGRADDDDGGLDFFDESTGRLLSSREHGEKLKADKKGKPDYLALNSDGTHDAVYFNDPEPDGPEYVDY